MTWTCALAELGQRLESELGLPDCQGLVLGPDLGQPSGQGLVPGPVLELSGGKGLDLSDGQGLVSES